MKFCLNHLWIYLLFLGLCLSAKSLPDQSLIDNINETIQALNIREDGSDCSKEEETSVFCSTALMERLNTDNETRPPTLSIDQKCAVKHSDSIFQFANASALESYLRNQAVGYSVQSSRIDSCLLTPVKNPLPEEKHKLFIAEYYSNRYRILSALEQQIQGLAAIDHLIEQPLLENLECNKLALPLQCHNLQQCSLETPQQLSADTLLALDTLKSIDQEIQELNNSSNNMEQIQKLKDQKDNIQKLYPWIAGNLFQKEYNPNQEYTEQEITMMAQNQLSEDRKKIKSSIDQLNTGFQCAMYERHCDQININNLLAQLPSLQFPITSEKDQIAQSYFNEIQCRQNKRASFNSKNSIDSLALNYTKYINPHNLIFDHQRLGLKISKEQWNLCQPDQEEGFYGLCNFLSSQEAHQFKRCLAGFSNTPLIAMTPKKPPSLEGLEGSKVIVETPPSEETKPKEIKPSEESSTNQQEEPTTTPPNQNPPTISDNQTPSEENQAPSRTKTPPSTSSSSLTGSLKDQFIQAINNGEIQGEEKFVEYTDSQGRKVRAEIVEIKDGVIVLRTADGSSVRLPKSQMSRIKISRKARNKVRSLAQQRRSKSTKTLTKRNRPTRKNTRRRPLTQDSSSSPSLAIRNRGSFSSSARSKPQSRTDSPYRPAPQQRPRQITEEAFQSSYQFNNGLINKQGRFKPTSTDESTNQFRRAYNSGTLSGDNRFISYPNSDSDQELGEIISANENEIVVRNLLTGAVERITEENRLKKIKTSPQAQNLSTSTGPSVVQVQRPSQSRNPSSTMTLPLTGNERIDQFRRAYNQRNIQNETSFVSLLFQGKRRPARVELTHSGHLIAYIQTQGPLKKVILSPKDAESIQVSTKARRYTFLQNPNSYQVEEVPYVQ